MVIKGHYDDKYRKTIWFWTQKWHFHTIHWVEGLNSLWAFLTFDHNKASLIVSNHLEIHYLFSSLFRLTKKKTLWLYHWPMWGESPKGTVMHKTFNDIIICNAGKHTIILSWICLLVILMQFVQTICNRRLRLCP